MKYFLIGINRASSNFVRENVRDIISFFVYKDNRFVKNNPGDVIEPWCKLTFLFWLIAAGIFSYTLPDPDPVSKAIVFITYTTLLSVLLSIFSGVLMMLCVIVYRKFVRLSEIGRLAVVERENKQSKVIIKKKRQDSLLDQLDDL